MFGKRAKNQTDNQDQDFEGVEAEFADDFASQGQSEEEVGWIDDQPDSDESVEPELQDRRSSPLAKVLPFAALGVIAAVGVGFVYINYLKPSPAETASPVIAAAPSQPEATAAEPVYATAPVDTPTEATAETAAPVIAAAPDAVITNTEVTETATLVPAQPESVATAPTDIQQALVPEMAPVDGAAETTLVETPVTETPDMSEPVLAETAPLEPETTAIEPVAVPETAPVAVAPVVAPVQTPAPVIAAAPAAIADENLADMSGRMDVLERQLEDLTKAVDRMATNAAANTPQPAVDTELKNTVTALQDQVRKLQSELANVRTAPAVARPVASEPAPARPVATRSATAETPRTRPAVTAPVRWVLRAAQSNEAWVSRSSEGELRSVTVGQSLEGIGRVTSIRQTGSGGWEIVGTQGSLRQ